MEARRRDLLLAETQRPLDSHDWDAVVRIWQPWIEQGDAEAEFQLAYHYLWFTPCEDENTCKRMEALIRNAAGKDHPDAIWFLATHLTSSQRLNPERDRLLLRAGELGSAHAQRELGVRYATGDWSGPTDRVEAVRWYRLAAEQGDAESQYDLGLMLLLGEGGARNVQEGLIWLEHAAELGEVRACRLLADCFEKGLLDVPADAQRAARWRSRAQETERRAPINPSFRCSVRGTVVESSFERLKDIKGVTGLGYLDGGNEFYIWFDPEIITPATLQDNIRDSGIPVISTVLHPQSQP